jgi:hypothetical protein
MSMLPWPVEIGPEALATAATRAVPSTAIAAIVVR